MVWLGCLVVASYEGISRRQARALRNPSVASWSEESEELLSVVYECPVL